VSLPLDIPVVRRTSAAPCSWDPREDVERDDPRPATSALAGCDAFCEDPVVIRAADAERDAGACAEIYAPAVLEGPTSFEEVAPGAAEMAKRMGCVMATHPWLVAEEDGRVVGFAYATPHRERAAYRWACDVSVYVDRAHHRRGVGRRLYDALLPLLRAQRFYVACAGITLPNDASVRLHESLGFEPIGIYRSIGFKAGAWRDVGWWQLSLLGDSGGAPAEPLPPEPE
jgi:L-amino acid N-acyltransferase YncA